MGRRNYLTEMWGIIHDFWLHSTYLGRLSSSHSSIIYSTKTVDKKHWYSEYMHNIRIGMQKHFPISSGLQPSLLRIDLWWKNRGKIKTLLVVNEFAEEAGECDLNLPCTEWLRVQWLSSSNLSQPKRKHLFWWCCCLSFLMKVKCA